MTTKTKHAPNSLSRREETRKKEQCQLCRTKVDLKDQYTVENDIAALEVVKKKNATRKGAEKASHYCSDCAAKRVKQKGAWMQSVHGSGAGNGSGSKAEAKAATKAAVKKPAAKAKAAKPAAAKQSAKAKALARKAAKAVVPPVSDTEPF